jgi:hypothetical protein
MLIKITPEKAPGATLIPLPTSHLQWEESPVDPY